MSKTCQKIYIAGKISGDNDYRAKFNQAKNKLKKLGYIVLLRVHRENDHISVYEGRVKR